MLLGTLVRYALRCSDFWTTSADPSAVPAPDWDAERRQAQLEASGARRRPLRRSGLRSSLRTSVMNHAAGACSTWGFCVSGRGGSSRRSRRGGHCAREAAAVRRRDCRCVSLPYLRMSAHRAPYSTHSRLHTYLMYYVLRYYSQSATVRVQYS